ncbi:hypothetical protein [Kitasatospora purpeofusca]|uniref:hypothetical protein n=1 Tax=Kitasatospora purpeofusca TaxID=67352 RepID=UPI003251CD94|nr:hypothetical protein OIP63_33515 [Kitasatospora purpeofusca]
MTWRTIGSVPGMAQSWGSTDLDNLTDAGADLDRAGDLGHAGGRRPEDGGAVHFAAPALTGEGLEVDQAAAAAVGVDVQAADGVTGVVGVALDLHPDPAVGAEGGAGQVGRAAAGKCHLALEGGVVAEQADVVGDLTATHAGDRVRHCHGGRRDATEQDHRSEDGGSGLVSG